MHRDLRVAAGYQDGRVDFRDRAMTVDVRIARAWAAAVAGVGVGTVVAAPRISAAAAGPGGARPDPRIIRVLGARQALQGAIIAAKPTPDWVPLGVFADASHALSMVGLAAVSRRYRRPALISGVTATASALVGAAAVRRSRTVHLPGPG